MKKFNHVIVRRPCKAMVEESPADYIQESLIMSWL